VDFISKRRLRVTADDFGFTPGVTDGILEAHEKGIVTHTSIMAGGLDFDRAVTLSRKMPGLGVGVHLTLTWGAPLSPPSKIPSLVGADGKLVSLGEILKRFLMGRLDRGEVAREWEAQIQRVSHSGISPTHLDSHHHLHLLPGLLPLAAQCAHQYHVPWLRRPAEAIWQGVPFHSALVKRIIFRILALRPWPLPPSDAFRGLSIQGRRDYAARLTRTIRGLPQGTTEFMVHPGKPDTLLEKEDTFVWERAFELKGLCDPGVKRLLKDLEIVLDRPVPGSTEESL
jgi:chitin disaccharide deacetylase